MIYPSGTRGKLDVANVAVFAVEPVRFKSDVVTLAVTSPPVIVTAFAFCVAIVPRPVTLAAGTLVKLIVTLPVKAPPPVSNPPANTLTVLGTAPVQLATAIVIV